jgi:tetratricopeptide (TPR) repeat protein/predicted Ser/Thr protein kinase
MNDPADVAARDATVRATGLTVTPGDHGFASGTRVGRYMVLDRVGGGGMGVVYSAYDAKLDRRVALKLLRPDTSSDEAARQLLTREAQTLARLTHPNVVTVHDAGEVDGHLFLAMEFVEGDTLSDWFGKAARTSRETLEVFVQAGRGLSAAHAAGVVHRDFKPDNVIVGRDGRVRVVDFGIALAPGAPDRSLVSEESGSGQTMMAATMGTPPYMAPERFLGTAADARSDQWSFCVALFEALLGAHPFAAASPVEISTRCSTGDLPWSPRVPTWIRPILQRGMSSDPDERFGSMAELLDALSRDLSTSRRRAAALGIVLAAALGAIGLYVRAHERRASVCAGSRERASAVWSDERKAKLSSSFASIHGAYAQQAWTSVASELDMHVREWVATRTQACQEVVAQRGPDAVGDDPRLACLDDRLREMAATADELGTVTDAKGSAAAVVAVNSLLPVASCDRGAVEAARPGHGPAVERVKAGLARIEVLDYFSKRAEAASLASEVQQEAEASGDDILVAQALRVGAYQRAASGDVEGAEEDFHRAIARADEVGDDRARAYSLASLIFFDGYRGSRWVEARRWHDDALAVVARVGGDDRLEAVVRSHYGLVLGDEREYAAAAAELTRASELYERLGAVVELGAALDNLGTIRTSEGEWALAQTTYERALSTLRPALGDHPRVAKVLNNMADLFVAQGLYERALAVARQATQIDEGLDTDPMDLEEPVETTGEALLELGRYDEAIAPLQRSLSIEERSHASQRWQSETLADLGRAYVGTGQPDVALQYLERVVQAPDEAAPQYLAEARFALARALDALHRSAPRAAALARAAKEGLDGLGTPSPALAQRREQIDAWLAARSATPSAGGR